MVTMNHFIIKVSVQLAFLAFAYLSQIAAGDNKAFKICSVSGGLDVARLVSGGTQNFFRNAIEDVELIREYISEAAFNKGIAGGFHDFRGLNMSLDWEARNLSSDQTTVSAGLGYTDDRADRRIDRYVSLSENQPYVGSKESDMTLVDSASNIFPWIVDRRSIRDKWWTDHQNGRTLKHADSHFDRLYTAAWIGTKGEAWLYYPPLRVYGHPYSFGDVLGSHYDSREEEFVKPNLPENNPEKISYFTKPYPDTAVPGLSLITAQAPVYFSGSFGGNVYENAYIASTGVDIAVSSVSSYLDILENSLTANSFAMLVGSDDFSTIVISDEVVKRLYPELTGNEEGRVTYDSQGNILNDRRGVPYLPSDTILEELTKLNNANWTELHDSVRNTKPGERGIVTFNITLTGEKIPTEFYVVFDKWQYVANWTLLVFAPIYEVEHATNVLITTDLQDSYQADKTSVVLQGIKGELLSGLCYIVNNGTLDVLLSTKRLPDWVQLTSDQFNKSSSFTLPSGESILVKFQVLTAALSVGTQSSSIVFHVEDDNYPDCLFQEDLNVEVSVLVSGEVCTSSRKLNDNGECVCPGSSAQMSGRCVPHSTLLSALVIPLICIPLLVLYFLEWRKRKLGDSTWKINESELKYNEPPQVLGMGAFGTVYLAQYRGTDVAVKKIHKTGSGGKGRTLDTQSDNDLEASLPFKGTNTNCKTRGLFSGASETISTEEMRVLVSLRHPCVTTIMGAVFLKGQDPMLVIEYMEQGSLSDFLETGQVELEGDLVKSFLCDISQGVQFLHNAKPQIVHCDLKGQNILLDMKLRAKVSDFGIRKVKGTSGWMAPELVRGETGNTTASDIYAFGMILFEIYARKKASSSQETGVEVAKNVVTKGENQPLNKCSTAPEAMPKGISALFDDCLRPDPQERPMIDEIASRIRRFEPIEVEPVGLVKRATVSEMKNFDLLLKVFPRHIAEALRDGRDVEPQNHECVTIFFSDIVGFTTISSELPPQKVSDMLHRLFHCFDQLAEKLEVFKVETIGDAWMGVTNCVKDQSKDHVKRIAEFAIGAVAAANRTLIDLDNPERGFVQIRAGFHSGPVLSNVIGSNNPRYTLLGDTVNTASRMESNSEAGCILCSERSAILLQQQEPYRIQTFCRGDISVKGKGIMKTFWVR